MKKTLLLICFLFGSILLYAGEDSYSMELEWDETMQKDVETDTVAAPNPTPNKVSFFRFAAESIISFDHYSDEGIDMKKMLQSGKVYNQYGQRVNQLVEGNIYVVEGKKVLYR